MVRHRDYWIVIALMFVMVVVASCNIRNVSNEDLYYQALGFWTDVDQNFHLVYDPLPDTEKAKMINELELLLDSKKYILNPWKLSLASGDKDNQYAKSVEWKKMKNKLILEIVNKYTTKEGG